MMNLVDKISIVSSAIGLFHLATAILAMLFGSVVLLGKKGTQTHRKIGYAYVWSMVLMNLSGFGIYNFGGLSLFHGFALVSLATLGLGLVPAIKKTSKNWYAKHFHFMSWSVVGLYCAFWAETGSRMFEMQYFWWVVMLASVLTGIVGGILIKREAKKLNLA